MMKWKPGPARGGTEEGLPGPLIVAIPMYESDDGWWIEVIWIDDDGQLVDIEQYPAGASWDEVAYYSDMHDMRVTLRQLEEDSRLSGEL